MKISGNKIELSELFAGVVLKSDKTEIEITERDGGFFINFNGLEIRLIENNPIQIEPIQKSSDEKESDVEEIVKMWENRKINKEKDSTFKPAFMPTFSLYVPVIEPSKITCEKLKTNILGGINEL